jgi:hypothetical protein
MHHDFIDDVPQDYQEYVCVFYNLAEVEGYIKISIKNEASFITL